MLEKLELIERQPHPGDRRAILVCLTEQGRKYATEINGLMVKANRNFLVNLDFGNIERFRDMLKQVQVNRP
jgi:DNA-binding MarR family transcriptional regulator